MVVVVVLSKDATDVDARGRAEGADKKETHNPSTVTEGEKKSLTWGLSVATAEPFPFLSSGKSLGLNVCRGFLFGVRPVVFVINVLVIAIVPRIASIAIFHRLLLLIEISVRRTSIADTIAVGV